MARVIIYELLFFVFYPIVQTANHTSSTTEEPDIGEKYKIFRCQNGKYINHELFCNTDMDCSDRSDEGIGCFWRGGCGKRRFACFNGAQCIMPNDLCDKNNDCSDGSDEWNCGDQFETDNCSLSNGKFLCHDKKRCLDLEYACDGYFNCLDDSDENINCTKHGNVVQECPSSYILTPEGPICPCNQSDYKYKSICGEVQNCTGSSSCEQNCHMYKGKKYCSCFEDYHFVASSNSSGNQCRSNELLENIILYSTITRIKSLNLTTNRTSTLTTGVNCTALAAAHDYVYYAMSQQGIKNYIYKIRIDSYQGKGEKLIEPDSVVTSIAVDYITNNIYFTTNESLFVCTNDGKICTRLKCCGMGYVTLAPTLGLMFYAMKGSSDGQSAQYHIMKSNMDGEDEGIFVDDIFGDPRIPVIVNERAKKVLYLVQSDNFHSRLTLEYMTMDGNERETRYPRWWSQLLSLTALNEKLFFSEKNDNIIRVNYFNMSDTAGNAGAVYFRDASLKKLNLLYAHNKRFQRFAKNPCAIALCPGLCLLRPTSFTDSSLNHTCSSDTFTFSNGNHPMYDHRNLDLIDSHSLIKILIFLLFVTILGFGIFLCRHKCSLRRYYSILIWKSSPPEEQVEMVKPVK